MRKVLGFVCASLVVLGAFATTAHAVDIQVAPQTINLASKGQWLTIHVDIPYRLVDTVEVTVNEAPVKVAFTKPDDCDDLVVKVDLADVKKVLEGVDPGPVTVAVDGATKEGGTFSGTSSVEVVKTPKR